MQPLACPAFHMVCWRVPWRMPFTKQHGIPHSNQFTTAASPGVTLTHLLMRQSHRSDLLTCFRCVCSSGCSSARWPTQPICHLHMRSQSSQHKAGNQLPSIARCLTGGASRAVAHENVRQSTTGPRDASGETLGKAHDTPERPPQNLLPADQGCMERGWPRVDTRSRSGSKRAPYQPLHANPVPDRA